MSVGEHPLGLETVQQRATRAAVDGERELPGEVVSVVETRVETLAPERA